MDDTKYAELETRATDSAQMDLLKKLESKARIHQEIEIMRREGKALTLTDEEIQMLESFRRFKLRMRKKCEVFTWQTLKTEGAQIVEDTALISHPNESA